jgi:F-type H+-transporting ATPase subunit b
MNINLTLFAQAIVFAAFIWVTVRFIWPWMMDKVEARQKHIAAGLAAADAGTRSLDEAQKKIAQLQTDARTQSQGIVGDAERRARGIVDEAKVQAKVEVDRMISAAKAEAQQEMQRAKTTLRDQVAVLVVAGAEQILKREVNSQVHADLLNQLKAKL